MSEDDKQPRYHGGSGAPQCSVYAEQITRPDWNHWSKIKVVSIESACWLAANVEPRKHPHGGKSSEELLFKDIEHFIGSALVCDELTLIRNGSNYSSMQVNLSEFSMLVVSVGFDIPGHMRHLCEKGRTQINSPVVVPTYLDEKHPMFSRELSIAIEAWEHVLACNPAKPKKGSRKGLIEQWLDENYKSLPNEAKIRISVMLNPDSKGGAPSNT